MNKKSNLTTYLIIKSWNAVFIDSDIWGWELLQIITTCYNEGYPDEKKNILIS